MVPSPLKWVRHYFDDIFEYVPFKENFYKNLVEHFNILEQLIQRFAFRKSKIKVNLPKQKIVLLKLVHLQYFCYCRPQIYSENKRTPLSRNKQNA